MTSFSPSLSALTTNPDGRYGRSPTTVLISRSGDTSTGARSQLFPVKGTAARGRIRQQPEIAPQVAVRAVVRKNRRRFTPSSKTEFRERWIFEGLYTFILAEERSPRLASILDGLRAISNEAGRCQELFCIFFKLLNFS